MRTDTSRTERPHVSPTQLDMYLRCGEQYRRRYILGERIPPGVALVKGAAVHRAAEVNYRQKVETHVDLPAGELQAAAAAHVDEMVQREGLLLTAEERGRGASVVKGEVVDRATALTDLFAARVAPVVQPALVEEFVTIPLPNSTHDIVGRLDVADTGDVVRDLKTGARRKSADEVARSDQLTFYHLAFHHHTGRPARGVTMDVLVDKKRPEVQTLEADRTVRDAQVFVHRLNAMLGGVRGGVFPPAPLGAWCCSPRFCGYWDTCPYVNAERQAAADEEV